MISCVSPYISPYIRVETLTYLPQVFDGKTNSPMAVPDNWTTGYNWVGDFNGDGLSDIATAYFGTVLIKYKTSLGFTQVIHSVPPVWNNSGYNWVGDFNGDGWDDIASAFSGDLHIKLNNGPNGPAGFTQESFPVPPNEWNITAGYNWVGDFNGDGWADLASAVGTNVYLKLNNGPGGPAGFTQTNFSVSANWNTDPAANWVGDFNGDGLADFASAFESTIILKLNTGAGFSETNYVVSGLWGSVGYNWVGDFNGDGLTDFASAKNAQVMFKFNTGMGFEEVEAYRHDITWGVGGSYAFIGDFDGDGRDDIARGVAGNVFIDGVIER